MKLPQRTVCGVSAVLVAAALSSPSLAVPALAEETTSEVRTDEIPIYPELVQESKTEESSLAKKPTVKKESQPAPKDDPCLLSKTEKSGQSNQKSAAAAEHTATKIAAKGTVAPPVIKSSAISKSSSSKDKGKPDFSGVADYYADMFHGKKTASGQIHDKTKMTAAHRSLPFGTKLRITNRKTGKSCCVVINDRGPFTPNRIIDLSYAAAKELGLIRSGSRTVDCAVVADSPDGSQTE